MNVIEQNITWCANQFIVSEWINRELMIDWLISFIWQAQTQCKDNENSMTDNGGARLVPASRRHWWQTWTESQRKLLSGVANGVTFFYLKSDDLFSHRRT